ncbi:hypothetical protein F5B17DRAFT_415441 [Nemania serpens]|nr:hypothetical protein F5B17DRAFT_415441 [Nemania serpens]
MLSANARISTPLSLILPVHHALSPVLVPIGSEGSTAQVGLQDSIVFQSHIACWRFKGEKWSLMRLPRTRNNCRASLAAEAHINATEYAQFVPMLGI